MHSVVTVRKGLRIHLNTRFLAILALLFSVLSACTSDERFQTRPTSDLFAQNYNPEYLDILWVVDDRSPMRNIADKLTAEATRFFLRLDQSASQYRMGIITMDMMRAQGRLQPLANPYLLQRNVGTTEQRATNFRSMFPLTLNLSTGAQARAFEATNISLNNYFVPRANTPLVLVFISDGDDVSVPASGQDAVTYFKNEFLALKNNQPELLRVYSISLWQPLPMDQRNIQNRCTNNIGNSDIDKATYERRLFRLAEAMGGSIADICGSFADQIDLTGLRLSTLPKRFTLTSNPDASTIKVSVYYKDKSPLPGLNWVYDAAANQIVFDQPPPEGTTVEVAYTISGA